MSKVTHILPKSERFRDDRQNTRTPQERRPARRASIKSATKKLAPLFKAFRLDQRFAAPRLAAVLESKAASGEIPYWFREYVAGRALYEHYAKLPFAGAWERIGVGDMYINGLSSAHVALKDPSKIACYPTRADAARRREVVMSPGKYFAAIAPEYDCSQVQALAESFAATHAPVKVHFVHNKEWSEARLEELGDEWVRVYREGRGFRSCMTDFDEGPDNPIRFYAYPGNELSLAYLTHNGDPQGDVVARAICNMEQNAFVRVYGDARLRRALERSYSLIENAYQALDGVVCNAFPRRRGGTIVAPYLDGDMQIEWNGTSSTCVITSDGNYAAQETNGLASGQKYECDCCGDYFNEGETSYLEYEDRRVCNSCRDEYYEWAIIDARGNEDYVHQDNIVSVCGATFINNDEVISRHGYVFSEREADWQEASDCVFVEYLGDYILYDDVVNLDVPNRHGDCHALEEDTKTITLNGVHMVVFMDYDGLEDDETETAEALEVEAA